MSYIYIYIHAHTDTHTHSRADLTVYFFLLLCDDSPRAPTPSSAATAAAARQRAQTHFKTHTHTHESHTLIFLAIVQPFHSSKPYHRSLHSCSRTQTRTSGFTVRPFYDCFLFLFLFFQPRIFRRESLREALFSPPLKKQTNAVIVARPRPSVSVAAAAAIITSRGWPRTSSALMM